MALNKSQFSVYCTSPEDAIKNIDECSTIFAEHGIIVFKQAFFSEYDVVRILTRMGKILGWTPNHPGSPFETLTEKPSSEEPATWKHVIKHNETIIQANESGMNAPESQIIQWHLDGVAAEFQHLAAGWNMQVFKCSKGSGSSGFVDMQEVLEQIPDKFMNLLNNCMIAHMPIMNRSSFSDSATRAEFAQEILKMNDPTWILDVDDYISSYPRQAIAPHPHTGVRTLRTDPVRAPWGFQDFLFSVDGRLPTSGEYKLFDEYFLWFDSAIHRDDLVNKYWHEWDPGDFVVPDLFRMLHGVRGGFQQGERIFNAYWCFPHGTPKHNEKRISISEYESIQERKG